MLPRLGAVAQEHGRPEREGEDDGYVVEVEERCEQEPKGEGPRCAEHWPGVAGLQGDRECDQGEARPPAIPTEGGAPHQKLGMERRKQKQAYLRAGARKERGDLEEEYCQAGVGDQTGENIDPAEGWQDAVGKVRQEVHAGRVNISFGVVTDDFPGRRGDVMERGYLVVVEVPHRENSDGQRRGDQEEGGRESAGGELTRHNERCVA